MRRIFIVGYMGAGKTCVAKALAKKEHLTFVDLDNCIEKYTNKTISDIFSEQGEDGFRQIERDVLHNVAHKTNAVISCGGGTPCFFDNMDFMNTCGETVYLHADIDYILHNLQNSPTKRPLLEGLEDKELRLFIEKQLKEREPFYKKAKKIIEAVTFPYLESSL